MHTVGWKRGCLLASAMSSMSHYGHDPSHDQLTCACFHGTTTTRCIDLCSKRSKSCSYYYRSKTLSPKHDGDPSAHAQCVCVCSGTSEEQAAREHVSTRQSPVEYCGMLPSLSLARQQWQQARDHMHRAAIERRQGTLRSCAASYRSLIQSLIPYIASASPFTPLSHLTHLTQ